jgi:hypothetical protein
MLCEEFFAFHFSCPKKEERGKGEKNEKEKSIQRRVKHLQNFL